jgi:CBS-domain-containing membrane protein
MRRAKDIMTRHPIAIQPSAAVSVAVQIFQGMEIRHLPVVDYTGKLVGMLSERDLRALAIPNLVDFQWFGELRIALEAKVGTVMSTDVISLDDEADAMEIVDLMLDHKIGAVPIVNVDGGLVGIVSYIDMLRELSLFESVTALHPQVALDRP